MQTQVGNCNVEIVVGDITQQETDAIVNAANSELAGGGGVDGAIHRAGGPSIMTETQEKYPGGCHTGDAVITGAGELPTSYVVHAVGPVWSGGQHGEQEKLSSAYRRSMEVALDAGCESIAFPSLSTGAYRYPVDLAARAALRTVLAFLRERSAPKLVRFVLFDQGTYGAYAAALEEIQEEVT